MTEPSEAPDAPWCHPVVFNRDGSEIIFQVTAPSALKLLGDGRWIVAHPLRPLRVFRYDADLNAIFFDEVKP